MLAHPVRRGVIGRIQADWLERLAGIEIWIASTTATPRAAPPRRSPSCCAIVRA